MWNYICDCRSSYNISWFFVCINISQSHANSFYNFASFFAFWAFTGAFLHAIIDAFDNDYNENRWLRVTQGFCAIFEIVLASVTLSQRTSDQEGNVIATPQTIVLAQPIVQPIYQPVVQTGYQPVYQHGVQPGVQLQAMAYPPTAPPTYTG